MNDTADHPLDRFGTRLLRELLVVHEQYRVDGAPQTTATSVVGRQQRFLPRSVRIGGAVAIGAGLLAAGAIATSQDADQSEVLRTIEQAGPVASGPQVQEDLRAKFALFRDVRPSGVPDADNEKVRLGGVNYALARTVESADGEPVIVIPGSGLVCIRLPAPEGAAGSCAPLAIALQGRLTIRRGSGRDQVMAGLVPDGIGAVRLELAGGKEQDVVVHDNVWTANAEPRSYSLIERDGGTSGPAHPVG